MDIRLDYAIILKTVLRNIKITICCMCFMVSKATAQEVYVVADMTIKKITIGSSVCSSSGISTNCMDSAFSIALIRDTMYYIWSNKMYRSIRQNNVFTNCTKIGNIPSMANSLTVGEGGLLYFALGNSLYRMNPNTGQSSFLGLMPFGSAGDLTYYKGELYMASESGIVKINTTTPSLSEMHIPIPNSNMFGLASIPVNCSTNRVFGLSMAIVQAPLTYETKVVELDMDNKLVLSNTCQLPFLVMDAASVVENGSVEEINIKGLQVMPDCDNILTANMQVLFTGSGNYTFQLQNGMSNNNGLFTGLNPGNYNLQITSANGCNKDTSFEISQLPPGPVFTTKVSQPNCEFTDRTSFSMQPSYPGYMIQYQNQSFPTDHIFESLGPGEHHFVFTDTYGCRLDSTIIHIAKTEHCDTLFFPNAFTPNGDGKNDIFKPSNRYVKEYTFYVFNRWGQQVFFSNNIYKGWNGKSKDKNQPPAGYVWIAGYTTANGYKKFQKGTVLLIR